jgi:peptide subunit release factor 1 (eRF1)
MLVKSVNQLLDDLAAFEPVSLPVISLYLNTQPNDRGRADIESFVRKDLNSVAKTYPGRSPERSSIERDTERIIRYVRKEIGPEANGAVIFACAAQDDFFEAAQLAAAITEHRLYVYHQPHLYPLARLADQYRRYAAIVADTNAARLFVFALGMTKASETIKGKKTSRASSGGWSQARYQRRGQNAHTSHAKEIVEALDQLVREEKIDSILIAGDDVILPLLRQQLPAHLADKLVDALKLDLSAPEHEIIRATFEAMRKHDATSDQTKVQQLLDEYRAGGLAVIGAHDTLIALTRGQGDELLICANVEQFHPEEEEVGAIMAPQAPASGPDSPTRQVLMADALVTRARQTGASVTFVEDSALLAPVGGVGLMLRYK